MFSYDSGFSTVVRKLMNLVVLSCTWLLCCLPVITIGASTVSLIYTIRKYFIEDEGHGAQTFFRCFRQEFGNATRVWLVFLGASLFLGWDTWYFLRLFLQGGALGILAAVTALMLLGAVVWCLHCFYYLAWFEDGTRTVLKNGGRLALVHPLANLELLLFTALFLMALIFLPYFLLILPAAAVWLTCRTMTKIYKRLLPQS